MMSLPPLQEIINLRWHIQHLIHESGYHKLINLRWYIQHLIHESGYHKLINLRWYIQHLIHESGYLYDDVESNYLLSEDMWILQTHGKFMKYVFYTLHRMTHEQMMMNLIKPIIKVKTNEKLDKVAGESIIDEQEYTISNKQELEYSTFSDMSKQNF